MDAVNGISGLVYETDESNFTPEEDGRFLNCYSAESILYGHQLPSNNLNMALFLFLNNVPMRGRLESQEHIWELFRQFDRGNTTVGSQLLMEFPQLRRKSIPDLLSELILLTGTPGTLFSFNSLSVYITCTACRENVGDTYEGPISVSYPARNSTTELVEILQTMFQTPQPVPAGQPQQCSARCEDRTREFRMPVSHPILSIHVTPPSGGGGNISLPLTLNLTEIRGPLIGQESVLYRLYGFATNDMSATFRIHNDWFMSNNGTSLTWVRPFTEPVVLESVNLVLYERL